MQTSFLNWVLCRHNEKCPIPSALTMLKMTTHSVDVIICSLCRIIVLVDNWAQLRTNTLNLKPTYLLREVRGMVVRRCSEYDFLMTETVWCRRDYNHDTNPKGQRTISCLSMSQKGVCICVCVCGLGYGLGCLLEDKVLLDILFMTACVGCTAHDWGQACWNHVKRRAFKKRR